MPSPRDDAVSEMERKAPRQEANFPVGKEDNDEESRLRARLLAKKAELMRENDEMPSSSSAKKSEKEKHHHHHHKKKKKRHSSGSPQDKTRKVTELDVGKFSTAEKPPKTVREKSPAEPEIGKPASHSSRRVVEIKKISMQNVISAKIAERLAVTPLPSPPKTETAAVPPAGQSSSLSKSEDVVCDKATAEKHPQSDDYSKTTASSSEKKTATAALPADTSFDEELETLGPNIQPPQVFLPKKFKKRDKKRPDETDNSPKSKRLHVDDGGRILRQPDADDFDKFDKKTVKLGSHAKSTVKQATSEKPHQPPLTKYPPHQESGARSLHQQQLDDHRSRQETIPKTFSDQDFRYKQQRDVYREKTENEERKKYGYPDRNQRDARHLRTEERRRKSRSPEDRREHPPAGGAQRGKRSFSPSDRRSKGSFARENRWLPKLTSQASDSQQSRYTRYPESSRDRSEVRAPRPDSLYGPPQPSAPLSSSAGRTKSPSKSPPRLAMDATAAAAHENPRAAERRAPSMVASSKAVAQTPTLDEAEDKNDSGARNAKMVSKNCASSPDHSPVFSPAGPKSPGQPRKNARGDDSMESGEERSENEDGKKDNVKQKYSKFESSPELDSGRQEAHQDHSDSDSEMDVENGNVKDRESDALKKNVDLDKESAIKEEQAIFPVESDEEIVKKDAHADLPAYYPAIMGCRSVEEFQNMNKIEEGTYGVVYRATEKRTGEVVALKRLKMEKEKEGFPITSLREINMLLKAGQHPHIVKVREIVVGSNMDKIYLVMDYVPHDLKSLMETMSHQNKSFETGEIKTLMRQLLDGVHYLHENWILHRDLKTSNLLFSHEGILKIGDFGLAREYGSPLKPYTPIVVTLWYRAPELLLGIQQYSTAIDMWSVGCIFAEFLAMKPFFTGKSDLEQLQKIFKTLGTPNSKIWEGYDDLPGVKKMAFVDYPFNSLRKHFNASLLNENGFNLLNKFLTYDPKKRIDALKAYDDAWFKEEFDRPIHHSMFSTWPAKSERTSSSSLLHLPPTSSKIQPSETKAVANDEILSGLKIKPSQTGGFSLKFGSHHL